jgi:hypothetical protein
LQYSKNFAGREDEIDIGRKKSAADMREIEAILGDLETEGSSDRAAEIEAIISALLDDPPPKAQPEPAHADEQADDCAARAAKIAALHAAFVERIEIARAAMHGSRKVARMRLTHCHPDPVMRAHFAGWELGQDEFEAKQKRWAADVAAYHAPRRKQAEEIVARRKHAERSRRYRATPKAQAKDAERKRRQRATLTPEQRAKEAERKRRSRVRPSVTARECPSVTLSPYCAAGGVRPSVTLLPYWSGPGSPGVSVRDAFAK